MQPNYSGNKKRREEAKRKKQEEKRRNRLNRSKNKPDETSLPGAGPAAVSPPPIDGLN